MTCNFAYFAKFDRLLTYQTCIALNSCREVILCPLTADSHIACRAHAVPMPCRAAKGLECLSHLTHTVRPCLIHTCHAAPMPCSDHAVLFQGHSTARPVGYLPAFGFFRLTRGVPRRLLSEAYQSPSLRSIPTTVKSDSSTLQKRRSVKLLD
jgi:hypothetical protein